MKFKLLLSLSLVALLGFGFLANANAAKKDFRDGELIIQFTRDAYSRVAFRTAGNVALTGLTGVDALNAKYQVSKVEMVVKFKPKNVAADEKFGLSRFHVIKFPKGTDIEAMAAEYEKNPQIERAYPNHIVRLDGVGDKRPTISLVPNDPSYPDQWGLNNTGNAEPSGGGATVGTPGADINAEAAWNITTGSSAVILAIIDTGVDTGHPEFAGRIVAGWDFANGDSDPMDDNGHGTSVAGIAAAAGNNGQGVAGVNWNCMIMPVKFLDATGSGAFADGAASLTFATDNGASVINNSWGSTVNDPAVEAAVDYAHANNVLVVSSRGNGNSSAVNYPGSYTNSMGIIALSPCNERKTTVTCDGEFWWGSSFGSDSDVSAPGTRIWTTDISGAGGFVTGDYWGEMNGTSAASPFVAGIAALVRGNEPGLTNDQVRDRINSTAVDIDAPGFDAETGWGRVDTEAALTGGGGGGSSPVVTDIPDQTITDGGVFANINLDDFVSDADHADSDLAWTTSGGVNVTVSIDVNRVASISYTGTGAETITFTATDPDGNFDSDPATFTVNAVGGGSTPVVSDIPDQTVADGDRITYSMNDFVTDPDTPDADLTWTWSGNSQLTVQYRSNTQTIRVTVPTGFTGSETVTFTATDPEGNSGSDAATYSTAGGGGSSPVVTDIPDQTITDGGVFANINLDDFVSDADHADSDMTWTTSGGANVTVSIDASRVASISYTGTGSETITFTATDPDGNSDSDPATFTINAVGGGNAPVVSDIPDQTLTARITLSMNDFVTDPDNTDAEMTWSWSGNTDLTVQYRSSTQQIRITPPAGWNGSETITFTATDPDGNSDSDAATYSSSSAQLAIDGGTVHELAGIPETMILERNYPNPFNPTTSLRYGLNDGSWVTLKIYNSLGQEIKTLVNEFQSAGYKTIVWNGRDNAGRAVSSGIYIYRMTAGDFSQTQRMVFSK